MSLYDEIRRVCSLETCDKHTAVLLTVTSGADIKQLLHTATLGN